MPEDLLSTLRAYAASEVELVERAYQFAKLQHGGQVRKSGEPYIIHPYEVALILAKLEADPRTVAAGLLHDVLEDTPITAEELTKIFGPEIVRIVQGVTKVGKLSFSSKEERQAENFRRMFLAMAEDPRVIVVKLADRLHNMRTLHHMTPQKQREISQETLDIYAPLAHRLGMGKIKWELEDLCLRYLYPDEYRRIMELVSEGRQKRESYIQEIVSGITEELGSAGVKGEVFGRPKHFYSIWLKLQKQNKDFSDLFDVTAVRIIVDSIPDCYHVLGIVHNLWHPIPGRFKDYIAMPKPNLYQSLHTSVMGPKGAPFEIQIRTKEMHRVAELGIAAHWRYKEGGAPASSADEKLAWLRNFLDWQSDLRDAEEYLNTVKEDLFGDEVFVFTPRGDVIDLRRGATPIDFAYRIHSSIGHRCSGAKVNGRIVPLDTNLSNGDIVEVMTTKVERPSLDWLNFVATNAAKQRIRQWFKKQRREENIILGREALERELDRLRALSLSRPECLAEIAPKLKFANADDVLAAIGYGEKTAAHVAQLLRDTFSPKTPEPVAKVAPQAPGRNGSGILVEGTSGMLLHLSKCCSPVPGEPISGVVTRGRGISVHSQDCQNLSTIEPARRISVDWSGQEKAAFPVEIAVEVIDRVGLLKDITVKMADLRINIRNVEVRPAKDKIVMVHLVIDVSDLPHLQRTLAAIGRISDVIRAYRVAKSQRVRH